MLHILTYLFIVISTLYTLLVVVYLYHWSKHPSTTLENQEDQIWPSVSVIVPFRNELPHLSKLLHDLKIQSYSGRYEVVLINDHSTDNMGAIFQELPENFKVVHASKNSHGKKSALAMGVSNSQSEYLLFTDADTQRGTDWITAMMTCAIREKADMVTGPVLALKTQNLMCAQYYRSELAAFMVVTAGAIGGGLHAMANGANMLVKSKALPSTDPFGKQLSESGDDLFLAEQFFKTKKLVFCKSNEALVTTYPPTSETELIQQKIRWASKNKLLSSGMIRPAMLITASLTLAIISSPVLALLYGSSLLWFGLVMFLIKTVTDHVLINQGLSWQKESITWDMSLRQQLTNLMITTRTLLALLMGQKAQWKEREI